MSRERLQRDTMQAHATTRVPDLTALDGDIRSPKAKLVYLYLATSGGGSAEELATELGLRRLDVYGVLDCLRGSDLVVERDGVYVPS